MDTKSRVRAISLTLFFSIFTLWVVFYIIISASITDSAEKQVALAADQIMERLSAEFYAAERLSYSLKRDPDIQTLAHERDAWEFFLLAENMDMLPDSEDNTPGFVGGVVLFGGDGLYYRLNGILGNRACSLLYEELSPLTLPSHLAIELDGKKYLGYADEVPPSGTIVILTEEEKVLEILRAYDQSGSLLVAISAGGEIVAANTDSADFLTDAA